MNKLPFIKYVREYFGTAHFISKRVAIPMKLYQKLELVHNILCNMRYSPRIFYWWIFDFALSCFYELAEKNKVLNIFQMLSLNQTIKKSLMAFVEVSQEKHGFIQIPHLRYIYAEMLRRKFTNEDQLNFLNFFVENNKMIIGKQIVYSIDDINKIFDTYASNFKRINL